VNLKSVCLLLSLFHASSAIALGLGELSVRSHLGQALHVTGGSPQSQCHRITLRIIQVVVYNL